jgi:mevalonate pyrophosphate decarboxylase
MVPIRQTMTAVHPTAFKQQVAKKKKKEKEEKFAKQKSTRLLYASGRTNYNRVHYTCVKFANGSFRLRTKSYDILRRNQDSLD